MSKAHDLISLLNKKDFGLTEKEKEFTALRLQGESPAKAAEQAYDCNPKNASSIASNLTSKESYKKKIVDVFIAAGLNMEVLLAKHKDLISQNHDKKVALASLKLAYEMLELLPDSTGKKNMPREMKQINVFQGMKTEDLKREIARLI